jgi:hypothetical protein
VKIEPTYITFEHAKWVNKKGLLISCEKRYNKNGTFNYSKNWSISAPEQWQVVEWLRVNHGIWVESLHRGDMGDFIFKVVELNENNWKKHPHYIHNEGFNSPQEAYSAAFDYIKDNNLI